MSRPEHEVSTQLKTYLTQGQFALAEALLDQVSPQGLCGILDHFYRIALLTKAELGKADDEELDILGQKRHIKLEFQPDQQSENLITAFSNTLRAKLTWTEQMKWVISQNDPHLLYLLMKCFSYYTSEPHRQHYQYTPEELKAYYIDNQHPLAYVAKFGNQRLIHVYLKTAPLFLGPFTMGRDLQDFTKRYPPKQFEKALPIFSTQFSVAQARRRLPKFNFQLFSQELRSYLAKRFSARSWPDAENSKDDGKTTLTSLLLLCRSSADEVSSFEFLTKRHVVDSILPEKRVAALPKHFKRVLFNEEGKMELSFNDLLSLQRHPWAAKFTTSSQHIFKLATDLTITQRSILFLLQTINRLKQQDPDKKNQKTTAKIEKLENAVAALTGQDFLSLEEILSVPLKNALTIEQVLKQHRGLKLFREPRSNEEFKKFVEGASPLSKKGEKGSRKGVKY